MHRAERMRSRAGTSRRRLLRCLTALAAVGALALPAPRARTTHTTRSGARAGAAHGPVQRASGIDTDSPRQRLRRRLRERPDPDLHAGRRLRQVVLPPGTAPRTWRSTTPAATSTSPTRVANTHPEVQARRALAAGERLAGSFVSPSGVAIDSAEQRLRRRLGQPPGAEVQLRGRASGGTWGPVRHRPRAVRQSRGGRGLRHHALRHRLRNDRVQRCLNAHDGSLSATWGDRPCSTSPIAVASPQTGRSFVADNGNHRVRAFDAHGSTRARSSAAAAPANGQFASRAALPPASLNRFFVTDDGRTPRAEASTAPITGSVVRTSGTRLVFDAAGRRKQRVS